MPAPRRLDPVRSETMALDVAARRAGFSKSMLYEHFKAGDLPFPVLEIGRVLRVPVVPFERWLAGLPAIVDPHADAAERAS